MVTKAKTPPEEEVVEEPKETVEKSDESLRDQIMEVLKELGVVKSEETATETEVETKTDDGKPLTYRQEEAQAHSLVSQLVEEFKREFNADDSKKDDKKEPETKPGPKQGGLKRWVEQNVWGIE